MIPMTNPNIRSLVTRCQSYFQQRGVVNTFDMVIFFRQFATLITAGVPIVKSCDILEKSQDNNSLQDIIHTIKSDLLSGKTLYYSLQRHPVYFDALTCQLIKIGENTGRLDAILQTIAQTQENNQAFQQKIKQALFYPTVIMVIALIVTGGMFVFVIPKFAELFHDIPGQLPFLTQCLFSFSALLRQSLGSITICISVVVFLIRRHPFLTALKSQVHTLFMKLPFIKTYTHKVILARFIRHLAFTLAAGIPIMDALILTAQINHSAEFTTVIMRLRNKISTGLSIHHAMAMFPHFPVLMIQMIKIGEESGMLEAMLNKMADFFEADIDRLLTRLNQLLEPLIMILLGVLIGGLVIGIYLPVFRLGAAI